MTPAFRQNPRPVGQVLPMTRQDAIYPHRLAMPAAAWKAWQERNQCQ